MNRHAFSVFDFELFMEQEKDKHEISDQVYRDEYIDIKLHLFCEPYFVISVSRVTLVRLD